jgi:hypothetical protein
VRQHQILENYHWRRRRYHLMKAPENLDRLARHREQLIQIQLNRCRLLVGWQLVRLRQ